MRKKLVPYTYRHTINIVIPLAWTTIFLPFHCYNTNRKSDGEYSIHAFCLFLLSIVIVKGTLLLANRLDFKNDREELIFGYSGGIAYSILAQVVMYYTDWHAINIFMFAFFNFHTFFLFCVYIFKPISKYIFFYGRDYWLHLPIIVLLTAFWAPIIRIPILLIVHLYWNVIISVFYIDLSCAVRGYMTYGFDRVEELKKSEKATLDQKQLPV
ncbi:unnamed protein product [Caenorhabditis nigoni]